MKLAELRHLTPRDIARMTESQARAAYSELRTGMVKQLARLEAAGYHREITSQSIPKLQQIAAEDVKYELSQLAYQSRRSEMSLSEINKRISGTQRWMRAHGYKNVTREKAKQFGEFMGRMRESGINSDNKFKRYMSMLDSARATVNDQGNFDYILDAFEQFTKLVEAGVDTADFQNGTIYGVDIREVIRHKKAFREYASELEEIYNGPGYQAPKSEKDVNNLLRRARRMRNRRG